MPHRKGKEDHGGETTGGLHAGAITGVISGSWVLVPSRQVIVLPGGCGGTITLITSPEPSLARAREESKATMHLGVKRERWPVQRQERTHGLAYENGCGQGHCPTGRGKTKRTQKKRTRGVNNKDTSRRNEEGWVQWPKPK
jgi:hypothetical protein